jgi:hypothetical protein
VIHSEVLLFSRMLLLLVAFMLDDSAGFIPVFFDSHRLCDESPNFELVFVGTCVIAFNFRGFCFGEALEFCVCVVW